MQVRVAPAGSGGVTALGESLSVYRNAFVPAVTLGADKLIHPKVTQTSWDKRFLFQE